MIPEHAVVFDIGRAVNLDIPEQILWAYEYPSEARAREVCFGIFDAHVHASAWNTTNPERSRFIVTVAFSVGDEPHPLESWDWGEDAKPFQLADEDAMRFLKLRYEAAARGLSKGEHGKTYRERLHYGKGKRLDET